MLFENIESVQRQGTKMLPGMKDLTYVQRLRSLNLPTLRLRRYRGGGDMIEVFKIMKGFYDNQCLPPLKLKNELGRRRVTPFSYKWADPIWNSLSQEVVDARNINQFKNIIDQFDKKCKFDYQYNIFDEQDIAWRTRLKCWVFFHVPFCSAFCVFVGNSCNSSQRGSGVREIWCNSFD